MKILLATSAAVPSGGGIASYNQELIKAIGYGNEFYLLTSANEHNVEGFRKTISTYGNNIYGFQYTSKIIKSLNDEEYDLIINSNSDIISVTAPFLKSPIISVAHFVNGYLADCAGFNNEYNNAIIALSYYGKMYLDEKFNIQDTNKVKVVYNFVHQKDQIGDKTSNKKITIVYPGGTSIKKSLDIVVDIAYQLKKTNLDFTFYWLGNTKLPSAKFSIFGVKDLRQMLHDDDRFIITGNIPREDAEHLISMANIFLLPSRGEGCPMTLLEAMRAGCIPIVSDARHGSRELIEQSRAGFVLKQGDSKSVVNLILDIIFNHNKYTDYYYKTKTYSETVLTPNAWRSKMGAIISDAVESPKKTIAFSEKRFNRLCKKYIRLKYQDVIKEMIRSLYIRIKLDLLYLKWRGWR